MNKAIITLIITVLFLGAGGGIYGGFFSLKTKTERVEKDVEKVEEKVEEAEDKINEEEKINLKQTILIEQINKDRAEQSDKEAIRTKAIIDALNKLTERLEKAE